MKNLKETKKMRENGITLVALVITIIILLILAGISISALTNTGIFQKAKEAKEKTQNAEKEQSQTLSEYEKELNKYTSEELTTANANIVLSETENVELHDKNGNKIVVLAGFKIVVNEDTNNTLTVDKGIVIEDATTGATSGSQFVWIPIENIKKDDGSIVEINLNRYTFDENGNATIQGENVIKNHFQELESSEKGNVVAKDIYSFRNSVIANKGYYVGRYEARKNKDEIVTEIGNDEVWNNITQSVAAEKTKAMYNKSEFTSDLMNSYAWDTATLFLQNCGEDKYSRKSSVNIGSLAIKGTNAPDYSGKKDLVCNVYDMASNVVEWTTETSSYMFDNFFYPCVLRGSNYDLSNYYTGIRDSNKTDSNWKTIGFRPILYLNSQK